MFDEKMVVPMKLAGPSGFEPESGAPEAPMLSKLYYEPRDDKKGICRG